VSATSLSWQRIDHAQPLRAWRGDELAVLCERLAALQSAWQADWGLQAWGAPGVACAPPRDVKQRPWVALGAGAWWVADERFEEQVARGLFDADAATPLARSLVQACRDDLAARLRALCGLAAADGTAQPPDAALAGPWSAAVAATLGAGIELLLQAQVVAQVLGTEDAAPDPSPAASLAPLVPVADAVARRRMPLRIALAGCELDLGTLQDLQVGDVVRTDHPVDAPALLEDRAGRTVFRGFLVRSGALKAVELTPAAGAPSP
jgi:hypothetical protein